MTESKPDPEQEQEWLGQLNVIYVGLMAIGIVMIQPFLTESSLDLAATICVIAFAVAIPLLAALVMVNRQETFRGRATKSVVVKVTAPIAQMAAFVGMVAGFWNISWIAGVAFLAAGLLGVGVHSAGYARLEYPNLWPGRG